MHSKPHTKTCLANINNKPGKHKKSVSIKFQHTAIGEREDIAILEVTVHYSINDCTFFHERFFCHMIIAI